MENSKISWTTHTFNPWRGCTKVSPGCDNCYAERGSRRNPGVLGQWGPEGSRVVASESQWGKPVAWNRAACQLGIRYRVFCSSIADVFEGPETLPPADVERIAQARIRLHELICDTPFLDWLLLTKRPQNVVIPHNGQSWSACWPDNAWLGVSVENQAAADERIPHLLRVEAPIRFLSCEPLLGPVRLLGLEEYRDKKEHRRVPCVDWVIVGGESGGGARPMQLPWLDGIIEQCQQTGVPCFVKQMGSRSSLGLKGKGDNPEEWPWQYVLQSFPGVQA